ncbi:gas vesicle protein [Shewanella salipaludis]|uniref:Gas vesicle protein n=1 Tax=Shewanella salipaludis TaxID=2723052 RepID=A0A972G197_9GAMM|nr:gas vesicle protein [Shewanella salipaludis]NMH66452.1 gas vesicle protein [Shewanella salipaludis]
MATGTQHAMTHSVKSTTVADLLERILDKGIVVTGDIKIKLVDVELLTIELRLVICSVDKAVEMGMDWWNSHPSFSPLTAPAQLPQDSLSSLEQRLERLEAAQNK